MSNFQINPMNLKALLQNKPATRDSEWVKWDTGIYQVRFGGPWNDTCGTVCRQILMHGNFEFSLKDSNGNNRQPICMKFLMDNLDIAKVLASRQVLSQDDVQKYQQFGCLGCKLRDLYKNSGNRKRFDQEKFVWNVIVRNEKSPEHPDGRVYKWSISRQNTEQIIGFYNMYNKLFDVNEGFDFNLTVTGEKMQRRYSLMPISSPCPMGNIKLYDLDDAVAQGYQSFSGWIELINNTNPQIIPMLGINPQMLPKNDIPF